MRLNNTEEPCINYPRDKNVHEIFEQRVVINPNQIAIVYGNKSLTYQELNDKADSVACLLLKNGIKPNDYVGISSVRSLEMVIGLLAILKVGAAYVPLDLSLPPMVLRSLIEDASLRICIGADLDEHTAQEDISYIEISKIAEKKSLISFESVRISAESAAYINFTSGTTGKPKGIICTHRGIIRLLFNQNYISLSHNTIMLQVSPISFDAATFEIWGALLHGGTCILFSDKILTCQMIKAFITEANVNLMFLTTALFHTLVDVDEGCFFGLKQLLVGGEVISSSHVRKIYRNNDEISITNCYGPTENTTFTCFYQIPREFVYSDELNIPIGKAIAHTKVYIVDHNGSAVTLPFVSGELYVGGDGLAKGYLNLPDLTSNNFITNPYTFGNGKLYKTGDLVQYRQDGEIEFIGRIDSEVKINGYRINIGVIENCINNYEEVQSSIVLVETLPCGLKILVVFIVSQNRNEVALRQYLREHLPDYSIPKKIVWKQNLPLTLNGKFDKKLLHDELLNNIFESIHDESRNPNESEKKLTSIWRDILGVSTINAKDNFFYMGGNSLNLINLDSFIYNNFGVRINQNTFYLNPIFETLMQMIESEQTLLARKLESCKINEEIEFNPAKNQLRFYKQYKINPVKTNMNIVFRVDVDSKNPKQLLADIEALILKNRLFNCKLVNTNNVLKIRNSSAYQPYIDINYCDNISELEIQDIEQAETLYMFNLLEQSPLRLRALATESKISLIINVHHLYFDGGSMFVLKKHLLQCAQGERINFPKLDYIDFCLEESKDAENNTQLQLFKKYQTYLEGKPFALSDKTNKNESYLAEGYQVKINKNNDESLLINIGIIKLLLAFHKSVYDRFGRQDLVCQVPMSRNQLGKYT
jgi:amino acid adenylation domain-containing protein